MEDGSAGTSPADVTLLAVTDPATAGAYEPAPTGRYVAAMLRITALGAVSDDANIDSVIIGSNEQTYTPIFVTLSGCTNFNNGEVTLTPGESAVGCVAYDIPLGVHVSDVRFGNTFQGTTGQWVVQAG
jgi:hypothetical protein